MELLAAFVFGGIFGFGLGLFVARSRTTGTLNMEITDPTQAPYLYLVINPSRQMDLYNKRYIVLEIVKQTQPR